MGQKYRAMIKKNGKAKGTLVKKKKSKNKKKRG